MAAVQEVKMVLNNLLFYGTGNVTTSAQNLTTIFSALTNTNNLRTIMIHNTDAAAVYFGSNNSVTTANGIPIDGGETREIPVQDIIQQPIWLIGSGTQDIRLEVWN